MLILYHPIQIQLWELWFGLLCIFALLHLTIWAHFQLPRLWNSFSFNLFVIFPSSFTTLLKMDLFDQIRNSIKIISLIMLCEASWDVNKISSYCCNLPPCSVYDCTLPSQFMLNHIHQFISHIMTVVYIPYSQFLLRLFIPSPSVFTENYHHSSSDEGSLQH